MNNNGLQGGGEAAAIFLWIPADAITRTACFGHISDTGLIK
jgi:hypothetical protein